MIAEYPQVKYRRSELPLTREEPLSPPVGRPLSHPQAAPAPVVRLQSAAGARPMGQRGPLVVRRVRALGWRSPETLAVLVASFVVSLAAIYVAAYARVAAATLETANLTRESRKEEDRKDALLARLSELSLASDMQKSAVQMNMVPNDAQSERLLDTPSVASVTAVTAMPAANLSAGISSAAVVAAPVATQP